MVTGAYGKPLGKSFGAPLRLHVPWKYGFKSIKSITKISFTDQRPASFWEHLQASEYGFWANVNPAVPHPRWSQANEEVLGTGTRRPTLLFNGYADYVADLYKDLDPASGCSRERAEPFVASAWQAPGARRRTVASKGDKSIEGNRLDAAVARKALMLKKNDTRAADIALRASRLGPRSLAVIIASAMFMEQLDATILATALPTMARSFQVDPVSLNVAMTSYLLSIAIFIPASGQLADRFGSRAIFRLAIA